MGYGISGLLNVYAGQGDATYVNGSSEGWQLANCLWGAWGGGGGAGCRRLAAAGVGGQAAVGAPRSSPPLPTLTHPPPSLSQHPLRMQAS